MAMTKAKTKKGAAPPRIVKIVHSGMALLRPIKGAPGSLELRILANEKDAIAAGLRPAYIKKLPWRAKHCGVVMEITPGESWVVYCAESADCPELCSLIKTKGGKETDLGKVGLIGPEDAIYDCQCR